MTTSFCRLPADLHGRLRSFLNWLPPIPKTQSGGSHRAPERTELAKVTTSTEDYSPHFLRSAWPWLSGNFQSPGNTFHFHWAKFGEDVTQVTAVGPLGSEYMNGRDYPRNNKA